MELLRLWLLIRWEFGNTSLERVVSQFLSLVMSTVYWFLVVSVFTFIISRIIS